MEGKVHLIIGALIDIDQLFTPAEGIVSCAHSVGPNDTYCPHCGTLIRYGDTVHTPTEAAKKLFGDDVNYDGLTEDADSVSTQTEELQLINVAYMSEYDDAFAIGILYAVVDIPEGGSGSIQQLPIHDIAFRAGKVSSQLATAGLKTRDVVRLLAVPHLEY